jgi:tetratricopeptide (TPR) repeat protein
MIVKNESARILRALDAAKPFISTYAILDTGSTDNTVELIRAWGVANDIKGTVGAGEFKDFSQARNDAIDLAKRWCCEHHFTHLLLQDADMQIVGDPKAFNGLQGECYEMLQTGGSVTYSNARVLAIWSLARYVGSTHEYLDVAPTAMIEGARFDDHADGANRVNKFERDVELLLGDVAKDPNNPRAYFYLGNSYRDAGQPAKAEEAYRKRMALGGWDEELYATQCSIATCRKDQGDDAGFVVEMLKAHELRPQRAEPLYDLAHHFRERGQNHSAIVFAERGLAIPRPDDRLFVNDYVYSHGLREEMSIAGYYSESTREKAFKLTNALALDRKYDGPRNLARANMVYYLQPLDRFAPSVVHSRIAIEDRINTGYVAMNPSVCETPSGSLECLVRTVNYKINEHGQYMIGPLGCQDAPIITENHLVRLSPLLRIDEAIPVKWDRPPAQFPLVIGLEDMRLFWKKGERRFVACVREQSVRGAPEQWEGVLNRRMLDGVVAIVENAVRISDPDAHCEKNWAPIRIGPDYKYVYRLDVMRTLNGNLVKTERDFECGTISGSSQWIEFQGGYLAVVHEAVGHPVTGKRIYQHRFAWTTAGFGDMKLTLPFTFQDTQIEFCAGLARHGYSKLIMSYGVRDEEAWLATISHADVAAMLRLK